MPSLVLVRHAQGSFGGASYDVLSALGHEQVQAVAAALDRRGMRVERIRSGTLRRQLDTAGPIADLAGLPVEVDARWNEYDVGDILNHHSTTSAREQRHPSDVSPQISSRDFQLLLEKALLEWIAAGDGSPAREPWPAFAARVRAALADAVAGLGSGGTAVVATSAGAIAAICVALLGTAPSALVDFNRVAINTGLTKVVLGRGGNTLVAFNEHSHLEGAATQLLTYR
jgi:broad specificity phosphatase PhoE